MLKKRTLALLLSLAMLLTFMPAMAFADDTADEAADQPEAVEVEDTAEEAVVEAAEDAVVEESADVIAEEPEEVAFEAKAAAVPKSAVFHHKGELRGWAGDNQIEDNRWYMSYEENEPNSVDVTFSDGSVKHYVFIGDDSQDAWGFYLDGKISNGETDFYYDTSVKFKEGKNIVDFYMQAGGESYKVGTVEVIGDKAKVDKLIYTQKDPLNAELNEEGFADYFRLDGDQYEPFEGDTVQVKAYNTVEVHDANDNVTIEYEPYEAIYKCKKGSYEEGGDEFYGFWLEKAISGDEWVEPHIEIKFWDDQTDSNKWKSGSTHEITATFKGVEAEGKIVVNVTGSAAPHTHVAGEVVQVDINEATCKKGGTYVDVTYCKECGEEMSRSAVKTSKPLGHSIHKIAAKPATCQETGVKAHYECTNCGGMFSDAKGKKATTVKKLTIKKKKHNYKEKKIDAEHLKSAATCTKPAVYYYSCKMCHEKGKKTFKSGKALGHKFEQAVTKATPTKNGSIGKKCTVCGKKGKSKKILKASKIAVVKKYKKKGVPESALAGGKFIEVKNSKGKKIAASEYQITFENNVEAGTGVATINFVGANYEGTKTVSYKIAK